MVGKYIWAEFGFFFLTGIVGLIGFNSTLGFSEFFDAAAPGSVFYMAFSSNIGGMLSFAIEPFLLRSFSNVKKLFTIACSILVLVSLLFSFAMLFKEQRYTFFTLISLNFIFGFFSFWFQSKGVSTAAGVSPASVKNYSLGTGAAGVISMIACYVLNLLYPPEKFSGPDFAAMETQVITYGAFFFGIFATFFLFLGLWIGPRNSYSEITQSSLERKVMREPSAEEQLEEVDVRYILAESFDINMGMMVNYISTINLVSYWVYTSYKIFGSKGLQQVPLALYYFMFNVGDMVSKGIPVGLLPSSSRVAHAVNVLKLLLNVYFFWIIFGKSEGFVVSSEVRLAVVFAGGILNGYMTNTYFVLNGMRFDKMEEKGKAGSLNVLFLLTGLTIGSFTSLLL